MKTQRLKILIVAHEFSPEQGSECAVGWNIVTRLSEFHDITVLYASIYAPALIRYFQNSGEIQGLTCINIERSFITRVLFSFNSLFKKLGPIGLPLVYYIGYKFWQKSAYKAAKQLHKINNFDIAHQLTQVSFREPG